MLCFNKVARLSVIIGGLLVLLYCLSLVCYFLRSLENLTQNRHFLHPRLHGHRLRISRDRVSRKRKSRNRLHTFLHIIRRKTKGRSHLYPPLFSIRKETKLLRYGRLQARRLLQKTRQLVQPPMWALSRKEMWLWSLQVVARTGSLVFPILRTWSTRIE